MKKIIVGLVLLAGLSALAQAAPVSMTGTAFVNTQNANYWHLGEEKGGRMIASANIPFEPEKMMLFQGKMVKITGELLPDRTTPTFDRGYTVEAVEVSP